VSIKDLGLLLMFCVTTSEGDNMSMSFPFPSVAKRKYIHAASQLHQKSNKVFNNQLTGSIKVIY